MQRRQLLGAAAGLMLLGPTIARSMVKTAKQVKELQQTWRDWVPSNVTLDLSVEKIRLSKSEWRGRLSAASFDVLRRDGTERPNSHPYNQEKRDGVFVCAGCELPLFTSSMKYDSGTGWPSFFTAIPEHLETKKDFKLIWPRTEYHCSRCGGHQGHVFDDGPRPTGERWCNNGAALTFWPKEG
nr:peptide methionine sulfoxide reductase MsrB-like [Nerophis lumbriciformis]